MLRQRVKKDGVVKKERGADTSDGIVANAFRLEAGAALTLVPAPPGSTTEFVDALDALRARYSLPAAHSRRLSLDP